MTIRILHIIHRPQRRGAEMFAIRLAEHLQQSGVYDNAICSLFEQPAGSPDDFPHSLKSYQLRVKPGWWESSAHFTPLVFARLSRVLRQYRPDIVIAHGSKTLKYASLSKLMYRRSKTIYKNIGTASFWANTPARVRFGRLMLRNMDAVVSVSDFTRTDFIDLYKFQSDRAIFIANAVDVTEFQKLDAAAARAEVRKEIGLPDSETLIVNVGSLSPGKGQEELIDLVSDLPRHGMHPHLALVGAGPTRQDLERRAVTRGVLDRVHFMGLRRDIPKVLSSGDIFVLTSATEGMPGVLIEAGLAGLASVAYSVGGVREVIVDGITGRTAAFGDHAALTRAVCEIAESSETRARMGASARRRCMELFDIREVSARYQSLFEILLKSRSKRETGARMARLTGGPS